MDPDGRSIFFRVFDKPTSAAPAVQESSAPVFLWALIGVVIGAALTLGTLWLLAWLKRHHAKDVTEKDVMKLVDTAEEQDVIDENQKEMISNIVEFDDVTAADVMTHRTDLVAVTDFTTLVDAARVAGKEGRSRVPVYRKTLDNIVGILYIKDLMFLIENSEGAQRPVSEIMRPAMFVPETCRAGELLRDFKRKHTQIAVVVDEYGGTSGLVTMEDILEEIVGNIQDEFDDEEEELVACEDGYVCDGSLALEDVFQAFDIDMPENDDDDDFETVSGLITQQLGRIPEPGEQASRDYGGLHFEVQQVDARRIVKVKCTRLPNPEPEEDE